MLDHFSFGRGCSDPLLDRAAPLLLGGIFGPSTRCTRHTVCADPYIYVAWWLDTHPALAAPVVGFAAGGSAGHARA